MKGISPHSLLFKYLNIKMLGIYLAGYTNQLGNIALLFLSQLYDMSVKVLNHFGHPKVNGSVVVTGLGLSTQSLCQYCIKGLRVLIILPPGGVVGATLDTFK